MNELFEIFDSKSRETQIQILNALQERIKKDESAYPENFEFAVEYVLEIEGILSNHPMDTGGLTKYGITQNVWGAFRGIDNDLARNRGILSRLRISSMGSLPVSVSNIEIRHAKEVYFVRYWLDVRLDRIASKHIAAECFDSGVNAGQINGVRFLQRALNFLRYPTWDALTVDGVIGPVTLGRISDLTSKGFERAIVIAQNGNQFIHYNSLAEREPGRYLHFTRGWAKRLTLFEEI